MTETLAERFLRFNVRKHRCHKETPNVFRISGSNIQAILFHDQSALLFEHNSGIVLERFNQVGQQDLLDFYFDANDEFMENYHPKSSAWKRYNQEVVA